MLGNLFEVITLILAINIVNIQWPKFFECLTGFFWDLRISIEFSLSLGLYCLFSWDFRSFIWFLRITKKWIWDTKILILLQSIRIDWLIFVFLSGWIAGFLLCLLELRKSWLLLSIFIGWIDICFDFCLFKRRFEIWFLLLSRWDYIFNFYLAKTIIKNLFRGRFFGILLLQSWFQADWDLLRPIILEDGKC